jgi:hypothetical protein
MSGRDTIKFGELSHHLAQVLAVGARPRHGEHSEILALPVWLGNFDQNRGNPSTSYPSIKAALEPVQLFEGICEGHCNVFSRFAVQPLCLDEPGTGGRTPKRASKVASGLGVVVGALPTGSVTFRKGQWVEEFLQYQWD